METINESGMNFNTNSKKFSNIENCQIHTIIKNKGIKIVDFLVIRELNGEPVIDFIEAKSSSPNPENSDTKFKDFIDEISDKFNDSLSFYFSMYAGRHHDNANELPENFKDSRIAAGDIRLLLIINGHKKSWLAPLRDALNTKLQKTKYLWGLPASFVFVLNDKIARVKGYIQ